MKAGHNSLILYKFKLGTIFFNYYFKRHIVHKIETIGNNVDQTNGPVFDITQVGGVNCLDQSS